MKPNLELLIEDIKYDIIEIENTDESNYIKVYEIYINIYKRVQNLKKEDFSCSEKYSRFVSYKNLYRNNGLTTENGIKNGLYNEYKYFQVRKELEQLMTYLSISQ